MDSGLPRTWDIQHPLSIYQLKIPVLRRLVMCFPSGGHTYADICKALGYATLSYGEKSATNENHPVLVATYDYKDVDGNILYQICRYTPKTFLAKRPDGQWGMGDVRAGTLPFRRNNG